MMLSFLSMYSYEYYSVGLLNVDILLCKYPPVRKLKAPLLTHFKIYVKHAPPNWVKRLRV